MATKRTTRTIGNRRYTTTTTSSGKTTRSESSAGKTKPGQTRITTTTVNGKTNTIRTTNMGGGWYERSTSRGDETKRRRSEKANREMWKKLSKGVSNMLNSAQIEPPKKKEHEEGGLLGVLFLFLIVGFVMWLFS